MSRRPIQPTVQAHADEDPGTGVDTDRMREALAHWASGVAILAVSDGEEIDALTVSAFSAVSMDPPLVLACVGEHSSTMPMLLDEGRFTISVLAEEQRRIASAVAGRLPGSLDGLRTEGDPVLEGAPAAFVCRLWEAYPGGDHRIVVGEVERIEFGPPASPLLYFQRAYRGLRDARRS